MSEVNIERTCRWPSWSWCRGTDASFESGDNGDPTGGALEADAVAVVGEGVRAPSGTRAARPGGLIASRAARSVHTAPETSAGFEIFHLI